MKITGPSRKHAPRHTEPVILFAVGEHRFAAPANDVDEIRDLHGLHPIGAVTLRSSVSKVQSTLERSGRTYFVVDAGLHFGEVPSKTSRLMVLRGLPVAVLVDSIDRMAEVEHVLPLPKAFRGEERLWYLGLALIEDAVVPIVRMASFLTAADQLIARSLVARVASKGVSA
jgi:hypothetical protein